MVALLFTACNKEVKKTDGYLINGIAKGVYNGMRVHLKSAGDRGRQTPQDTAIVMNETFKFEGKIDYPQMWYLTVDNVAGILPIMIENETIDINLNKDNIETTTISGSKSNEALSEYSKKIKKLMDKRMNLDRKLRPQINPTDSVGKTKITEDFEKIEKELQEFPFQFLKENNDTYFSLSLIENILKGNPEDLEPIDNAYANLNSAIKNSTYGQIVKEDIEALKKKNENLAMLNIGKEAPNFSAPDPDGKQVSLKEIRGKVTIIDFWASWCAPCRRENPNVVKVYNKYHDKGLEIIGVSLDKTGQKDNWLKAIEKDKLTWHHVSNLQYFNEPVAQLYNIQAIPATFILDVDGKIVAKNLRGQALEDKIAEILN